MASHISLYTLPCASFQLWACLFHYCGPGSGMSLGTLTATTDYSRRKCSAGPGKLSACKKKTRTWCCLLRCGYETGLVPDAGLRSRQCEQHRHVFAVLISSVIKSRSSDGQGILAQGILAQLKRNDVGHAILLKDLANTIGGSAPRQLTSAYQRDPPMATR